MEVSMNVILIAALLYFPSFSDRIGTNICRI